MAHSTGRHASRRQRRLLRGVNVCHHPSPDRSSRRSHRPGLRFLTSAVAETVLLIFLRLGGLDLLAAGGQTQRLFRRKRNLAAGLQAAWPAAYSPSMRNPGYVHELAALYLDGRDPQTLAAARRNGVSDSDLATATAALEPLSNEDRLSKIHDLYVSDARDKGYAEGDAEVESSWVLGQRAHAYYDRKGA